MVTTSNIAAASAADVQAAIDKVPCEFVVEGCGAEIHAIATELVKDEYRNALIPHTMDELIDIQVEEGVAALLMQHCFGSTELVVGINTRKLVVALDMFDWEECKNGEDLKQDIKMNKVPAERVKKSLAMWLPMGEQRTVQATMESLAALWGANRCGFWGKFNGILNKHFSPKDKKALIEMATSVTQFYKVVKKGGSKSKRRRRTI